MTMAEFVFYDV